MIHKGFSFTYHPLLSPKKQRRLPGRPVRTGTIVRHIYQFRDQDEQDQLRAATDAIHLTVGPIRISAPQK